MKTLWVRLLSQKGFLSVITAFLIVPALLGVVMIYDAATIMVARTGAYDTARAVAQLIGAQRHDQASALLGGCDTRYLTDRLEDLARGVNWDPFTVESIAASAAHGEQQIEIEVSVQVDRPFFGTSRYSGYAWLLPSKVFVDGTTPC